MSGSFGFKLTVNFNIALLSRHMQHVSFFGLEVLTFKMVIKVSARKQEVNKNATRSPVNIAINDNHSL